jgi:hypothetical protein
MMNTLLLRYGLGKFDFSGAIVSSLADGICAVDNRGRVTFMNAAAERMLIWTEAELLGKISTKPCIAARKTKASRCRRPAATCCSPPVPRRRSGAMMTGYGAKTAK